MKIYNINNLGCLEWMIIDSLEEININNDKWLVYDKKTKQYVPLKERKNEL